MRRESEAGRNAHNFTHINIHLPRIFKDQREKKRIVGKGAF